MLNIIRDLLQYLVERAAVVYLPNTYFGGGVQPPPRVSPAALSPGGGGKTRADTCGCACVGVSREMQIWVTGYVRRGAAMRDADGTAQGSTVD